MAGSEGPHHETDDPDPIVAFNPLGARLTVAAGILGAGGFVGIVVEGVRSGLTFGLMFRWAALWVVAFALVAGVLVALHALGGADTAQSRGERLSSSDVGLMPRRHTAEQPDGDAPHDPEAT